MSTTARYTVRRNDSVLVRFNPLRNIPAWEVLNGFGRPVGTYENEETATRQVELLNRMLNQIAGQQKTP